MGIRKTDLACILYVSVNILSSSVDEMFKSDTIVVSQKKTCPKGPIWSQEEHPHQVSITPSTTSAADGTTAANYGQALPQSPQSQLFGLHSHQQLHYSHYCDKDQLLTKLICISIFSSTPALRYLIDIFDLLLVLLQTPHTYVFAEHFISKP